MGPSQVPAIVSGGRNPEPVLDLTRFSRRHSPEPGVAGFLLIVRMSHGEPTLIRNNRAWSAGHLVPAPVEVFQPSITAGGPYDLGHGVRHVPQAPLAFPQRRLLPTLSLSVFLLSDVDVHTEHSRRPAGPVIQRLTLCQNPPWLRPGLEYSKLAFVGPAIVQRALNRSFHPPPIIRNDGAEECCQGQVSILRKTKHFIGSFRPPARALPSPPLPGAELCRAQGQLEPFLVLSGPRLHVSALVDNGSQHQQRNREHNQEELDRQRVLRRRAGQEWSTAVHRPPDSPARDDQQEAAGSAGSGPHGCPEDKGERNVRENG